MSKFVSDLKFAVRSLRNAPGLALTVVFTLALGIGANTAIFSVVRGVLLRPLNNRDEDRLIYIRQSAKDLENANFSVPEIQDLKTGIKSLSEFGDFSTIGFTLIGLGEPREVRAGVVGGTYFEVMGLRPVLGRLLDMRDDGPSAAGAMVLTYRFWSTTLHSDPSVLGKSVRLGERTATVVGVLEPTVPYPAETEVIANIVTSPHHLSATMVQGRVHRMTELFARLAPGATLESARAELRTVYASMVRQHPESYSPRAQFRISAVPIRDQITSGARTVLWVLLAASILVFVIACSNVANLILARTVRRQGEFAIRAALGAGTGALRRMLLAESLLLCGSGAILGILAAKPLVTVLGAYAARFSVRALEVTLDASALWIGAGLAIFAAVLLAFIPRLPSANSSSADGASGLRLTSSSVRVTGNTNRQLRLFAITQVAACFLLLAGASTLLKTLLALQSARTGFDMRRVLTLNVPVLSYGKTPEQIINFYKEAVRRVKTLPGVDAVAVGANTPWRDAEFGFEMEFSGDGYVRKPGEEDPRGRFRIISPGFFAALGVPLLAGRDFDESDRRTAAPVVIISQSVAERLFPHQSALNRHILWTDPVLKFIGVSPEPRRIIGIAADVDDSHVIPGAALTIYHPFEQTELWGGRLFIHTHANPYALVTPVTRIIRQMSVDQPVERAATLEDVRAEVLTPDRLNTFVFGAFAVIALIIALVGVAGVLAFSVSGRTREFGIRLAIGSQPSQLLTSVLSEGAVIAVFGMMAGALGGWLLLRITSSYFATLQTPGALPIGVSAAILLAAAVSASFLPALRASRVDVTQALRSE